MNEWRVKTIERDEVKQRMLVEEKRSKGMVVGKRRPFPSICCGGGPSFPSAQGRSSLTYSFYSLDPHVIYCMAPPLVADPAFSKQNYAYWGQASGTEYIS